jgi:hypothetical protein
MKRMMNYETTVIFTIKDNSTQVIKKYKFRVNGNTLNELVQRAQLLKDEIHMTLYDSKSINIDFELGGE